MVEGGANSTVLCGVLLILISLASNSVIWLRVVSPNELLSIGSGLDSTGEVGERLSSNEERSRCFCIIYLLFLGVSGSPGVSETCRPTAPIEGTSSKEMRSVEVGVAESYSLSRCEGLETMGGGVLGSMKYREGRWYLDKPGSLLISLISWVKTLGPPIVDSEGIIKLG